MQTVLHPAEERGRGEDEWLSARYSFSFARWYHPERPGFGALRVLNDDTIAPMSGFPMHGHRDMEIITVVTEGEVTHADSLGNQKRVRVGEVQVMSAGTGVVHSEENVSSEETLKLFQIWIKPRASGLPPRYGQKAFDLSREGLTLLVSPDGAERSLPIEQEAWISYARAGAGTMLPAPAISPTQGLYIFVIEGTWQVAGTELGPRDALGICEAGACDLSALTGGSALLIEVPLL